MAKAVRIIILRGLPGVGKTTIAQEIKRRLIPCAHFPVDAIRDFASPRTFDPDVLQASKLSALDMALRYANKGYNTIIESVFEDPAQVDELVQQANSQAFPISLFTLRAPLDLLNSRNTTRRVEDRLPPERVRSLYENYVWEIGTVMDVSERTVGDISREIIEHITGDAPTTHCLPGADTKLCLFMRHGAYQHSDRYLTPDEGALSREGIAQVKQVVDAVRRFKPERLVASNFRRCLDTAALLSPALNLPIAVDSRLGERQFTSLEGLSLDEIRTRFSPAFMTALCEAVECLSLPGEESIEDSERRVAESVAEHLNAVNSRLMVVSHGGPHSWLLCRYLGLPSTAIRSFTLKEAHMSLFEFSRSGKFLRLCGLNMLSPLLT